MDGFTEKKWFVYLGDHHEGPFSLAEIKGKLSQGQVTRQNYVWAEGMADWKLMTEVTEFESVSSATAGSGGGAEVAGPILNMVGQDAPTQITDTSKLQLQDEPSAPLQLVMPEPGQVAEAIPSPEVIPVAEAAPVANSDEATRMTASHEAVPMTNLAEPPQTSADAVTATSLLRQQAAKGAKRTFPKKLFFLLVVAALGVGGYYADQQGMLKPVRAYITDPARQNSIKLAIQDLTRSITEMAQPVLYQIIDHVPVVGEWISPIPALQGVSPEELAGLKRAAIAKRTGASLSVADFAVGRADPLAPQFYVAANAPDGTPLELTIEGISDTLLNQVGFQAKLPVTLQKRFGQTLPLKQLDQRLIPRGEYRVTVTSGSTTPGVPSTTLASRTVFLGGTKDATYTSRLKEYHDRLRDKARQELSELKQYSATLESQLNSTLTSFPKMKKQRKAWPKFHDQWTKMQSQLEIIFSQWTPERLAGEFFYAPLFTLTQQAAQALAQVHGLHHGYFVGGVDAKSFDIQLGEATSGARATLLQLKMKIDQAEKLPPTPNGMPRRDGL